MDTETPKDFFISYTLADQRWAEWIAWHLEAEGYQTRIQAWDFLAGSTSFSRWMPLPGRQLAPSPSSPQIISRPSHLSIPPYTVN